MAELYGDGIHDDWEGVQQLLGSGGCLVTLPPPVKNYLISKTLIIRSGQQLVLPRFGLIRLKDGSNCHMIENYNTKDGDLNI